MCSVCWQETFFPIRKNSVSQSVPADWHSKAEENSARIRSTFLKENVDVAINADETFLSIHLGKD
jgi:hypothetical protein